MREFVDGGGRRWAAEVISHGRTSGYLNPKVHRPVVQFTCLDAPSPRRYTSLPMGWDGLDGVDDAELVRMLGTAKVH